MTLGDRVAVLRRGVLQQLAPPQELYVRPANLFVAGFIGSPAMNLVEATVSRGDEDGLVLGFGSRRLRVPPATAAKRPRLASFVDRAVIVGIRPEDMEDAALVGDAPEGSRFPATIDLREDMGAEAYLHFQVDAPPALTDDTRDLASDLGSEKLEELREQASERRTRFVVRASPESRAAVGSDVEILVDTRKLHFFDPASGEAIGADAAVPTVTSVSTGREER
jgi:multiple sugar transport system ATP-binding protein